MDDLEHIAALMNRRIAEIRKASSHPCGSHSCPGPDHPLLAILIAALEAAIESGLLEPLHVSIEDSVGTVRRSTIQEGVISYADDEIGPDLQFPLRVLITDEGRNGTLDVNVETEKSGNEWIFRTGVCWLR